MLIVPGAAGEIGVLARHAPLVATLKAGLDARLTARSIEDVREFATGPGFFQVRARPGDRARRRRRRRARSTTTRAQRQLEEAKAELERVDAGESQADRWQLEQRISHAENQLTAPPRRVVERRRAGVGLEKREVARGDAPRPLRRRGLPRTTAPVSYFWVELPDRGYQDEKGLRRHISIVTSPTERALSGSRRLRDSAFKRTLQGLEVGDEVRSRSRRARSRCPEDTDAALRLRRRRHRDHRLSLDAPLHRRHRRALPTSRSCTRTATGPRRAFLDELGSYGADPGLRRGRDHDGRPSGRASTGASTRAFLAITRRPRPLEVPRRRPARDGRGRPRPARRGSRLPEERVLQPAGYCAGIQLASACRRPGEL